MGCAAVANVPVRLVELKLESPLKDVAPTVILLIEVRPLKVVILGCAAVTKVPVIFANVGDDVVDID